MKNRIDQLINFLKEIEKFKTIERSIYCSNKKKESDAEHVWHLAMFLLVFEKELPKDFDILKAMKMILVHDLPEIYAGDTFFFDEEKRKDKKQRELTAAEKLFEQLPKDLRVEFFELFLEYEKCETQEAKITQTFDKLAPILQNICSDGLSWKEHNLSYQEVYDKKKVYMEYDKNVFEVFEVLMRETKGILKN